MKQLEKFLEFYSETIKDGTLDKDSILMRVTGSQDRNFYRYNGFRCKNNKRKSDLLYLYGGCHGG